MLVDDMDLAVGGDEGDGRRTIIGHASPGSGHDAVQDGVDASARHLIGVGTNADGGLSGEAIDHGLEELRDGVGIEVSEGALGDALGEDPRGCIDEALVGGVELLADLLIADRRLGAHQEEARGRLQTGEVVDVLTAEVEHLDARGPFIMLGIFEETVRGFLLFADEGQEEIALAVVVEVDGALGEAGALGDVFDPCCEETTLHEDRPGRAQDLAAPLGLGLVLGHGSPGCAGATGGNVARGRMQVTTTSRVHPHTESRARGLGDLPCFEFVRYRDRDRGAPALLVGRDHLRIAVGEARFRWHPGLLHTRLEAGWTHPLVRAMDLQRGDRVLDSSLGLGTDAMFLARMCEAPVVAIEAVPAIALMTAEGLGRVGANVRVVIADGTAFMRGLPDDSFDIVQGDPMFPPGTGVTHSLAGIRSLARHAPLSRAWLEQARRVARKRVVIRDVDPGDALEALGCPEVLRVGRGRPRYGVWRSEPRSDRDRP